MKTTTKLGLIVFLSLLLSNCRSQSGDLESTIKSGDVLSGGMLAFKCDGINGPNDFSITGHLYLNGQTFMRRDGKEVRLVPKFDMNVQSATKERNFNAKYSRKRNPERDASTTSASFIRDPKWGLYLFVSLYASEYDSKENFKERGLVMFQGKLWQNKPPQLDTDGTTTQVQIRAKEFDKVVEFAQCLLVEERQA